MKQNIQTHLPLNSLHYKEVTLHATVWEKQIKGCCSALTPAVPHLLGRCAGLLSGLGPLASPYSHSSPPLLSQFPTGLMCTNQWQASSLRTNQDLLGTLIRASLLWPHLKTTLPHLPAAHLTCSRAFIAWTESFAHTMLSSSLLLSDSLLTPHIQSCFFSIPSPCTDTLPWPIHPCICTCSPHFPHASHVQLSICMFASFSWRASVLFSHFEFPTYVE